MNKQLIKCLFLFQALIGIFPLMGGTERRVEFRSAAFFHCADRFREIYGDVGVSYQLEASQKLSSGYEGWGNIDWYTQHGNSIGLRNPTRVDIFNFSFGVKHLYQIRPRAVVYLGLGASFGGIWVRNKTPCGRENASKFIVGGVLKSGMYYLINRRMYLDLFVDYLYQPVHFQKHVDVGGIKVGAGIGIKL